ncbi:MAG: SLC13 family permease, partial [Alphaproteobacteria bacterium]|nr:SLC13 family permease [Alphaproteobacteria bacterium]
MIQALFLEYASSLHMWVTFGLIVVALVLYAMEKVPLELTSLGILTALMLFFHFFPLRGPDGNIMLNPERLLLGFSNPALIAVLALLVLGQAVVRTGSLNEVANIILRICRDHKILAIALTLFTVAFISQFLNNTPACVIFMPIMAAIAKRLNLSASKVMIPLSYASIVGGITTLVGSSTNLLVSGALVEMGRPALGFFEFAVPGAVIAVVALTYIIFVLPKVLPNRAPLASELVGGENRQFVVQLDVVDDSPMIGMSLKDSKLFDTPDVHLKMVHRGEHAFLPPFDDALKIKSHDILIVSAPRAAISTMFSGNYSHMFKKVQEFEARDEDEKTNKGDTVLAEIVIAPASRMIGQNVEQIGFIHNLHCVVLGIQRRSRMITSRMTEIRLAAGDVLLVMGNTEDVLALREGGDVLVMEWSTEELPSRTYARRVNVIFAGVVGLAAFDIVPIHISALLGVMAVILTGCINLRQCMRALNAQIVFLVAAGLALSTALQVTGGASFLAEHMIDIMDGFNPVLVMGEMFMLMAF